MADTQGLKDVVKYLTVNVADITIQDDDDFVSICDYTTENSWFEFHPSDYIQT